MREDQNNKMKEDQQEMMMKNLANRMNRMKIFKTEKNASEKKNRLIIEKRRSEKKKESSESKRSQKQKRSGSNGKIKCAEEIVEDEDLENDKGR